MFFDSYDTPVFRPPSEARSFILRVTRGCAHNKCTYCNMYRGVPFQVLTEDEVARQIEAAAVHGRNSVRRVFLADGDALVLSTPRLLKILDALYKTFPKLQRVAAYSAPKDILRKSHEELVELREAGLKLLYYGMETGDDITLQAVKKGVSGEEAVEAGREGYCGRHEAVDDDYSGPGGQTRQQAPCGGNCQSDQCYQADDAERVVFDAVPRQRAAGSV